MVLPQEAGIITDDFLIGPYWRTESSDISADHSWEINKDISLNSGVEYRKANQFQSGNAVTHYDHQKELIIPIDENYLGGVVIIKRPPESDSLNQSHVMQGIYSQLKWQIKQNLSLFLGSRYDNVKGIDHKLSPRGAIVWQANSNNTLKLQYGESFRTPVNNELYSNDSITTGNPNLTSEFVKTTEFVWIYQDKTLSSEVVLFHNNLRDFINKVPYSGEALFTFDNTVNLKISGLETSANIEINEQLRLSINYTHLFDDPINDSFKHFGTVNLSYKLGQWQFNANAIWRDEVSPPKMDFSNDIQFTQKQYTLFSANLTYDLSNKHALSINAHNLLDKDYVVFDPRIFNGEVPGKGRLISVSYRYQF